MLSPKEKSFLNAYWTHNKNATKAAIAAGYSEKAARQIASRLLTKDNIKAAIASHEAMLAEQSAITVNTLLNELESSRKAALNQDNPQCSAAIAATMNKAKLVGLDHPEREGSEPQALNIIFTVKEPVKDMVITRGE